MEISQLRAFRALASTAKYSDASIALGKSQSTVNRQIKQLEEDLGAVLFCKTNGKYELTDQGKALLPHAVGVFDELDKLDDAFEESEKRSEKELVIATSLRSITAPFLKFREEFRALYPDTEVFLKRFGNDGAALDALLQGKVDVVSCPIASKLDSRFKSLSIGKASIAAICCEDHPIWSKGTVLSPDLAREETFIVIEGRGFIQEIVLAFLEKHGLKPKHFYRADGSTLVQGLVESCSGIGFLPEWSVSEELENGRFKSVQLPEPVEFDFQYVVLAGDTKQITEQFMVFRSENPPHGVKRSRSAHK